MSLDEINKLSITELVTRYNAATGKAVKRFASRPDGIKRLAAALGIEAAKPAPTSGEALQPATPPAAAPKPKGRKSKAGKPAGRTRVTAHAAVGKPSTPRPGSKREQLLGALRHGGLKLNEMEKRFDWKPGDCRDALRLLARVNGVAVAVGADGRWRVA